MRDVEQFRRVMRFYDDQVLSLRLAAFAASPVLLSLVVIAWLLFAALIG